MSSGGRGDGSRPARAPASAPENVRQCRARMAGCSMMSHQHGRFAFARGFFEALAHQRNEFRQARGLHGQLAIVALTDQRLGECLLRQTRAHVLGLVTGLREPAMPSATPSRIVARSRIETRSARRICSTCWIPETVMRLGTRSLTKSACSLQFLLEFLAPLHRRAVPPYCS